MKEIIFSTWPSLRASLGILVLRIIAGAGIMLHGWPKIQSPFSWMGPDATVPGFLQAMAAVSEVVGGIFLIIGFLTPLAALLIAITMATAAATVHIAAGQPFIAAKGGPSWELAALYFGIAVMLFMNGAGRLSLDYLLFGRSCSRVNGL